MSWLALSLFFTCGYIPSGGVYMYQPTEKILTSGMWYQQFEVSAMLFKIVEIGGSIEVQEWGPFFAETPGFFFWPDSLDSIVYAKVIIGPVTVGYEHECIHPVVPYQPDKHEQVLWDRWQDRVYLRIGGQL